MKVRSPAPGGDLVRDRGTPLRLMDVNSLGYLGLVGAAALVFHANVPEWPRIVLVHAALTIAIVAVVRVSASRPGSAVLGVARAFYPIVVLLIAWGELDALVPMLYGDYWAGDAIVAFEVWLFGAHPTVWFQQFFNPVLDEVLAIFYTGYYVFLAVPIVLYVRKSRETALAAFSLITFTYFTNFIVFLLLPALSPMHMVGQVPNLVPSEYTGYWVAALTRSLQSSESVHGAAFPSSHVAGALACTLAALRYERRLGLILLPGVLGVALGTVYLGYHHALDPIAGAAWAMICYPVARGLIRARGEDPLAATVIAP